MTSFILMSDSPCILQDFVSAGSLQSRGPKWHFSHITSLHWSWLLIINKTLMFKYFCLILNMIDMKRITFSFQHIHPLLIVHIQTMNHFIFLTKYIKFFFFAVVNTQFYDICIDLPPRSRLLFAALQSPPPPPPHTVSFNSKFHGTVSEKYRPMSGGMHYGMPN